MSYGNRGFIVASIGGLIVISIGLGAAAVTLSQLHQEDQATVSRHPDQRQGTRYPNQIDRDRAGLPYAAERVASGPQPADEAEREQRDLAAQESMSVWAFWMLVVSGVSAITTAIGTGFLLWQIILTRRAVEDTGTATSAMQEANDIARKAALADTRPILIFDNVVVSPAGQGWQVNFVWTNIGRGPCKIIKIEIARETEVQDSVFGELRSRQYLLRRAGVQKKDNGGSIVPTNAVYTSVGIRVSLHNFIGNVIEPIPHDVFAIAKATYASIIGEVQQFYTTNVIIQVYPLVETNGVIQRVELGFCNQHRLSGVSPSPVHNGIEMT